LFIIETGGSTTLSNVNNHNKMSFY
jgi:hypothetical protein